MVGNNLVQFGHFAIVGFLHKGEMFPPPDAGRDVGEPKFLLEDRILAFADL